MSTSNLMRRSNLATVWGGGLYVASVAIWHPLHKFLFAGSSLDVTFPLGHAVHHAPELPAYALLAVGLIGISRRYGPSLGWVGKTGLYLTLSGFAVMSLGTLGILFFEGGLGVSINALDTVHLILLLPLIGSLLCGPTILKAKVLSSEGTWLIMIASIMFLGLIVTGIIDTSWGYWVGKGVLALFSAGWTWLGYIYWLEGRRRTQLATA